MNDQARWLWQTLEFRMPAVLKAVDGLSEAELRWQPPNGANSASWLLWHIAEVEDNWVRDKVYGQPRRYPFGASVKETSADRHPPRDALLDYFREVRALSRERLEATSEEDFDRRVEDEHFGSIDVRGVWIGVATSCNWHGGQLVMLANRFIPRR
ncbi:MAG TPA: DinB family protein [Longimicrobiaceae bacterium]|nr:DinB family protein [Longimicrobiaceae bacterium]